jgi:protein ImuA
MTAHTLSQLPGIRHGLAGLAPLCGQTNQEAQAVFDLQPPGLCELVAESRDSYGAATALALAGLADRHEALIWVSAFSRRREYGRPYAHGLEALGWQPRQLLYVEPKREADVLWAVEEAARAAGTGTVLAEVAEADFTATRRLQLITTRTGARIVLLFEPGREGTSAARDRWQIAPLPSPSPFHDQRAIGPARWRARLLRSRHQPTHNGQSLILEFCHASLSLQASRLPDPAPLVAGTAGARQGPPRRLRQRSG